MAETSGFMFYYSYAGKLAKLTDEERGRLIMALLEYGKNGTIPDLPAAADMAFAFMAADVDRDAAKYAERCASNATNGAKGGRPKKANGLPENRTETQKTDRFSEKPKKANTNTSTNANTNDNTNEKDPPQEPPAGGDGAKKSTIEARFDEFWSAYPKRVGKQAALKSWKRIAPTAELHGKIMQAVNEQKRWDQWCRDNGRYIPNPATWLNQGRWDDEPEGVSNNAVDQGHPEQPGAGGTAQDWTRGFKPADDLDE